MKLEDLVPPLALQVTALTASKHGSTLRQKARWKMINKCPDCGSLYVEEVFDGESYCKDCFLHCATDDLEDASVFDRITASPEVLAEKLVHSYLEIPPFTVDIVMVHRSTIFPYLTFESREEAIAATVAKLKEVAK